MVKNPFDISAKKIIRGSVFFILVATLITMTLGCAGTRPSGLKNPADFVWPLPPDKPRIRFVRSIHSEMALGQRKRSLARKIFESLFGRPRLIALRKPLSVHVDKRGRLLVVDTGWHKVLIFDFANKKMSFLGKSGRGMLLNPLGVTSDDKGNIYVTDADGKRVIVYNSEGDYLSAFGGQNVLVRPSGIAVNSKLGYIYVVDTWAHQVKVFDRKRDNLLFTIGKQGKKFKEVIKGSLDEIWNRGSEPGEFRFPTNVAIGPQGHIYVVDTMNFRVQVFDAKGKFIRSFGQIGNTPGTFSRPKGIGLDSEGHIYVADAAFNNVQIFNQDGKILLAFGNFGSGLADLRLPAGLCVDIRQRIYVVDQLNHRVQVYQYLAKKGS